MKSKVTANALEAKVVSVSQADWRDHMAPLSNDYSKSGKGTLTANPPGLSAQKMEPCYSTCKPA